jgi:outer membrane immunogenic protein
VAGNSYRVFAPGGGLVATGDDDTRWGGAIGAGFEVGFAPNWSIGAQYDHLFMQDATINFTTPAGLASGSDRISQDIDVVTVRLNYKFGGFGGGPIVGKY